MTFGECRFSIGLVFRALSFGGSPKKEGLHGLRLTSMDDGKVGKS